MMIIHRPLVTAKFKESPMLRRIMLMATAVALAAGAADLRTPLFKTPPKIDGNIEAAEWAGAAGFDGFVSGDKLQRRRVRGFVGATETHLYVAIQSQLPDEGPLNTSVQQDSLKAVYDDSLEVYVDPTPDAADRVCYQFLANSLGKGGYNIHKLGNPAEAEAWRGDWQQAHSLRDGWWHFECAIPVASMGLVAKGRQTTDGVWQINLTRNWKPDWAWSSFTGPYANSGLRFVFTRDPAPAVQFRWDGDPTFPPAKGTLSLFNPSAAALELKALLKLTRNNMPELKAEQALTLAAGATASVPLAIDANDPTTVFDLLASVTTADGKGVFHERATKWTRAKEPNRWVTQKPKDAPPVDFLFAYYPSKNRLRLAVDINGLPKDAKPAKVVAVVRERLERKEVKALELPLGAFKDGRQEVTLELPPLEGLYEIAVRAEGDKVPARETVKAFERQLFPWEGTPAGRSTKVYPPFTAIKLDGRKLATVLRVHELNDLGLLDQVTATSANTGVAKPVLVAPMRYTAKVDGAAAAVAAQPLQTVSTKECEVRTKGGFSTGVLKAEWTGTWDYDGTLRVDLTLQPTGGKPVNELTLEIPLAAESATLIHANSDRIRAPIAQPLPAGEGVVWDASKVACDDFIRNFCPYIYLGSAVRGLCWFAENDKGWGWDPKTPNLDVRRQGNQVVLRVHLINQPTVIDQARTLTFGLLAAPVKPMLNAPGQNPNWWRYRYLRDTYSLLGTDINWFGNGSCGAIYPVGCDMTLWEALARGNREHLSDTEVAAVREYGLKYWKDSGQDAINSWNAHVNHNLRSRYGTNMVFYYNRATSQELPEFETFKDEWCLDDLRSIGKGKGRGEIKVVPSPSYVDFNLYWYARSFEVGNNKGAYWDNFFICPTYNTEMSDAYRRADGSIAPAAGIWGLRDLCKRTFIMMNERGMLPITFPHMTSFSPLPMLAFATVQYEWEWKYSEGDVQDRFTRDYLLLCTTGELAGAWPVPLSDQGKLAEDPWTQRTFAAVRLVHELDGYGGFGLGWVKSHAALKKAVADPVLALLDKPGLTVYRYWDDRPLPVQTGNPEVPTIVYSVPGQEVVAVLVSYLRQDATLNVTVDAKALGFTGAVTVTDVESGQPLVLQNGALVMPLKKHDVRVISMRPQ